MDITRETTETMRQLLDSQHLAVLATGDSGQPYCSLVAFVASADMREILFATGRKTHKYSNLSAEPRVSLLIDTRENREEDLHEAMAATAVGIAEELTGEEREAQTEAYVARHPHLSDFVRAPSCALVRVRVEVYHLVRRFQQVTELRFTQ